MQIKSNASTSLQPSDCFQYPHRIKYTQLSSLNKLQLEYWASGIILAVLRGYRAFKQSLQLVKPSDTLPLGKVALSRCQRLIRLQRKWQNIPQIDATAGRVKQKSVSVLQIGGKQQALTHEREQQILREYRQILKNILREFNVEFEKRFGHEPSKDDKEVLRPLYMEYKSLKQYVSDDFEQKSAQVEDPTLRALLNLLLQMK